MDGEKTQEKQPKKAEQPNINEHDKQQFELLVNEGLRCGGLHTVASKGFGKSRLLFSMAETIRNLEQSRVLIFDGSDSWLYGFSQIPTFNINNEDITTLSTRNTLEFEHFSLNNWELVKLALSNHEDILFRLRTRKPSKRGFFIRTVINYLDAIQREQRETLSDNQPKKQLAYFIEESQDAFNCRSTMRTEAEEFLTVFNEARNNKESFFTASQRLNDFSKTIRCKQTYIFGRINPEDINPQIRRIERLYNIDLTNLPLRNWLYNGEIFVSPQWTQDKKPYIVNAELRKEFSKPTFYKSVPASDKPKASLLKRILSALTTQSNQQSNYDQTANNINDDETANNIKEDEKGDFLALDNEDLIFSEEE
jgi:hypothetical protein